MNYLLTCFALAFIALTFAEACSDANERHTDCGSACPETCANMNENKRACITLCVSGCFCNPGYVRNNTGTCVLKRDCPNVFSDKMCADSNEAYTSCGTACPTTCANMNQTERICTLQCVPGCFCQEPYVREKKAGRCVLRDQCFKSEVCSDPNEVYNSCGTNCPLTCKNYANPPKICNRMCRVGCFCAEPYVRDEATGKCVLTKDC